MKTIIAILIALFSTCAVNAQTTYTLEQLVGTKWRMIYPEQIENNPYYYREHIDEYTQCEIKNKLKSTNKITGKTRIGADVSHKYYLSDVIPKSFDMSKVGKVKKGSYLITYYERTKKMEYYKIISLTNDSLKLFHKASKDEIRNVWVDFVRVK
ncbi:MAG: hypothetical protein K5874_09420 [Bacteroidaceae bacterium]|nr:hypothetical protein [Bacteroidaceae bacterium]